MSKRAGKNWEPIFCVDSPVKLGKKPEYHNRTKYIKVCLFYVPGRRYQIGAYCRDQSIGRLVITKLSLNNILLFLFYLCNFIAITFVYLKQAIQKRLSLQFENKH